MQIVYLEPGDDIYSLCDSLNWIHSEKVLFVFPDGEVDLEGLDLIRLRRFADRKRSEVGLVTTNRGLRRQANAVGLPTFTTSEEAKRSRRGWWRGKRRLERIGLPTFGMPMDSGKPNQSSKTTVKTTGPKVTTSTRQWLIRYAAILLFCLAGSLLYISFLYLIPRASITLRPNLVSLEATQLITAVPGLEQVDYEKVAIPARLITVTQSWKTEIETTGFVDVPTAPAQGRIVFTNVTSDTISVPAGTIIRTAGADENNSIAFQTVDPITVVGVEGGTAETDVVALEPGPEGNIERETLTILPDSFSKLLEVRNPAPMVGGALRTEAAVTEADLTRLRSQVLQFLQTVALSEMESQLTEREFLARESLQVIELLNERYSHGVGEQTERLAVEMEAALQATAVDTIVASGLVYEALTDQVQEDFSLVANSLTYIPGEVKGADSDGVVSFLMTGSGFVSPDFDLAAALNQISGQDIEVARIYLWQQLPLQELPRIDTWPLWVDRIPYLTRRIQTNIKTDA